MRIAFISTMGGGKWGGSEELWSLVAEEILKQGNQVFLSLYEGVGSAKVDAMVSEGALLHHRKLENEQEGVFNKILGKIRKKLSDRYLWEYAGLIKFRPEVLCINLAGSYDILYEDELRELIRKLDIPYAFICQGHDDIPFALERYRKTVSNMFISAEWIAFVSEANLRSAQRHLAQNLPNAFTANNPANLASTDVVFFPKESETVRFANVSRLDARQKGHDILFETLSSPKWRARNWTLTLAGTGVHEQYIKDMILLYQLTDKVKLAGQVSDMRGFWSQHHLLLLPSRYEGTPLALIEAMLCGRTAVVTDVAGNTEWITDEIGFIAAAPSSTYFDAAMEKMWSNITSLQQLGAACHLRAASLFDPVSYKKLAAKLYNRSSKLNMGDHK